MSQTEWNSHHHQQYQHGGYSQQQPYSNPGPDGHSHQPYGSYHDDRQHQQSQYSPYPNRPNNSMYGGDYQNTPNNNGGWGQQYSRGPQRDAVPYDNDSGVPYHAQRGDGYGQGSYYQTQRNGYSQPPPPPPPQRMHPQHHHSHNHNNQNHNHNHNHSHNHNHNHRMNQPPPPQGASPTQSPISPQTYNSNYTRPGYGGGPPNGYGGGPPQFPNPPHPMGPMGPSQTAPSPQPPIVTTPQSKAIEIKDPRTGATVDLKRGSESKIDIHSNHSTASILLAKSPPSILVNQVPPPRTCSAPLPATEPPKVVSNQTAAVMVQDSCPPTLLRKRQIPPPQGGTGKILESAVEKLKEVERESGGSEPQAAVSTEDQPEPPGVPDPPAVSINLPNPTTIEPPPHKVDSNEIPPPTPPENPPADPPPPPTEEPPAPPAPPAEDETQKEEDAVVETKESSEPKIRRFTRLELLSYNTKASLIPSPSQVSSWKQLDIYSDGTEQQVVNSSPLFYKSPITNGGFESFSRDNMRERQKAPLETLNNKSDNKFIPNAPPVDRVSAAEKKIQGILNKLTPEKYDLNVSQLRDTIQSFSEIDVFARIVDHVFEKSIAEPAFSDMYADLCRDLTRFSHELNPIEGMDAETEKVSKLKSPFRKTLLNKCQHEFQKSKEPPPADYSDADKEVFDKKVRTRAVGAIKFIGELFIRELLVERIIHVCIQKLLRMSDAAVSEVPTPEEIEMLIKLMFTVGKMLDREKAATYMDSYFDKIRSIMRIISQQRLKFLLQDVLDLRENNWETRKVSTSVKAHKLDNDENQFSRPMQQRFNGWK